MKRLIIFASICFAAAAGDDADTLIQIHLSKRISRSGDKLIERQHISQGAQSLITASSVYSATNKTLIYQTLKVSAGCETTAIEVYDPPAKSRIQFWIVKDNTVFAQCDLDGDGVFEIIVLFENGLPDAAFRREPNGLLIHVRGELWKKVRLMCQTGSGFERSVSK